MDNPLWSPCSGQARKPVALRHWGLYQPEGPPWVRALDTRGRVRLFASFKAAKRAADKLNTGTAK